ncbi:hypothetical protein B0O99DRAFT_594530 [Bisporella sp. PMI_857]|nr:hypothetical protein B0O99DRAFT_594530 [Bisporella sp. PMI_857]
MTDQRQPKLHNEVYPFISPEKFSKSLESQVAVIAADEHSGYLGAAGAIGSSISKCFSIAGAIVYLLDYNVGPLADMEKACLKLGAKAAYSAPIDIASYESCEAAIKKVKEDCGVIDVLVNGAGVSRMGIFHKQEIKWFLRGMSINFNGPLFLMHLVLPDFIARRRGCIINIASRHGTVSTPLTSDYNCSKASLIRLTQCLQQEVDLLQAGDVHMYALHPGGVRSDMSVNLPVDPSILQEFPQAMYMRQHFQTLLTTAPSLPGMVSVALATGIGKDVLRGRYIDCTQDLEDIINQADSLKADSDLYSMKVNFLGGLPNDEGWDRQQEEQYVMPEGF